jgi:hypothetical protein
LGGGGLVERAKELHSLTQTGYLYARDHRSRRY